LDLIEILKLLNVKVEYVSTVLIIDSSNIKYNSLVNDLVKKLRASYYFMGAMLALFKKCEIYGPGGCNFGDRPIDMHLDFFKSLNVKIECNNDAFYLDGENLIATEYSFRQKSVGATINALLLSSSINGKVTLNNISIEPEVLQVIEVLRLMGVEVDLDNDKCIIQGRFKKSGFMISIIPDRIEAGTYALIAAGVGKVVRIHQIESNHLGYLFDLFNLMNVKYEFDAKTLTIYRSIDLRGVEIETAPYPLFPTDLQQPLTSLLCIASGNSIIKETIYQNRKAHVEELLKMNAKIKVIDNTFYIEGNQKLKGNVLSGKDLRGGASLILAALLSDGESTITGLKYIERGYFNIIENLNRLGADIVVLEED